MIVALAVGGGRGMLIGFGDIVRPASCSRKRRRRRRMGNRMQCFVYWRGESCSQAILGMGLERS